ncbi:MAG: alpha/beta hydrolase [Pirellulales bacterium]|nr:alpha/beta hydrolase [Pirellulales bacterium]
MRLLSRDASSRLSLAPTSCTPPNRRAAIALGLALVFGPGIARAEPSAASAGRGAVTLADGRRIEYSEYGDPRGPLVLFFHGTPGSRFDGRVVADEARRAGIRLVAPNRPGIGGSTFAPRRTILDWPGDVAQLVDALAGKGAKFGVVGMSGGTPYALACAKVMPNRVTHLVLASSYAPREAPVPRGSVDRTLDFLERRPRLSETGVGVMRRRLDKKPQSVVERIAASWSPREQQAVLSSPRLRDDIAATLEEATLRGSAGVVHDARLLGANWGFRVSEAATVPIAIYHGGDDAVAPAEMAQWLHAQLPGSKLSIAPPSGHVTLMLSHAGEMFARFTAD